MTEITKSTSMSCFIIGPIGSKLAPVGTPQRSAWEQSQHLWEELIEPACSILGLTPIRSDKINETGEITEQIFTLLRDADIVIADVSGGNPNVMYELGLRHTRDKITIQVGEYDRLPFDINVIRTIQFRRTEAGLVDARDSLVESLKAALTGSGTPLTSTRLWNTEASNPEIAIKSAEAKSANLEQDSEEGDEEEGFIDVLAAGEQSMTLIASELENASSAMKDIGTLVSSAGDDSKRSDQQGKGFVGRLKIARKLASELKQPNDEMEAAMAEFAVHVERTDLALSYIFDELDRSTGVPEESRELLESISDMADNAVGSLEGTGKMMQGAKDMRKIANDLRGPSSSIQRSLGKYAEVVETMFAWKSRASTILGRLNGSSA